MQCGGGRFETGQVHLSSSTRRVAQTRRSNRRPSVRSRSRRPHARSSVAERRLPTPGFINVGGSIPSARANCFAAITRFGGPGGRARTSAAARLHTCRGHWSIAQRQSASLTSRKSAVRSRLDQPASHVYGGIAHWQGPPSRKRKPVLNRHERSTRSPSSFGENLAEGPGVRIPSLLHCRVA